jgi:mono/diheme cytochrome c family protein
MNHSSLARRLAAVLATAALLGPAAQAATPAELLAGYSAQAVMVASPQRGEQFFNATHGNDWSCTSCHGTAPTQPGKHASTGKPIGALAPSANAQRFSDAGKVDKWFRRNCNDVLGRECSAAEKADVMSWLIGLKP